MTRQKKWSIRTKAMKPTIRRSGSPQSILYRVVSTTDDSAPCSIDFERMRAFLVSVRDWVRLTAGGNESRDVLRMVPLKMLPFDNKNEILFLLGHG